MTLKRPSTRGPSAEASEGLPIDWLTVFATVILGLCCVGHFLLGGR